MAEKVINQQDGHGKNLKSRLRIPIEGKIGIGINIASKEIFIGVTIFPVVIEQVVKRRFTKTVKGKAKVFNFESI